MQLPAFLIEMLKSGKLTISEDNVPQMEIKVSEKRLDVNVTDKTLIKDVMTSARQGTTSGGLGQSVRRGLGTIRAARKSMPLVDDIVEDLCKEDVTITVSYRGDRAVTIGSDADSKLTRLLTGTKGIQINNALKLAEMTA